MSEELIGKELVDYSAGVPSPQSIKDAGNVGVVRYVSPPREAWMQGKPLTKAEADALKAAGLLIASNWQYAKGGNETSDWTRGAEGAREDAPVAQRIHEEAGGHPRGVIYVSVDANPTLTMYNNQVRPYLQTWQEIIGRERLGVYCNARVIDMCIADGIGTYFWQHNWSGDTSINGDHPQAHIHQYAIDSGKIDSVGVDDTRILKPMFGQWGTEDGQQTPAPPVLAQPPKEQPPVTTTNPELDRIEAMRGRWTGDPTWLPDVLRLWGLRVDPIGDPDPGECGHGDYHEVVGVVGHHTAGGGTNDWRIVKWGRPGLAGPLSQLVLEKDGSYKYLAVGVAWHAGSGRGSDYADKFTTDANWTTIGIEAVSRGTEIDGEWDWTDEQLRSYKVGVAAILWFLRRSALWFAGHREYNLVDGKIDPAGIILDAFRAEIQTLIERGPVATTPGGGSDQTGPPTPPLDLPTEKTDIELCRDRNPWLGNKIMVERELPTPDGEGRFTHYERGSIYFKPDRGALPVPKGGVYELWASTMWETGFLGYPKAVAISHEEGVLQEFDNGVICTRNGDPKGWPIIGGIRQTWEDAGGLDGKYGWPQSREYPVTPDTVAQDFTLGRIAWRMREGAVGSIDIGGRDDIATTPPPEGDQ